MVKKRKQAETATLLVPQASFLEKAWNSLKTRPAKITYKAAAGLASVAVAFHAALLNFPQLVTESGEEFVQRHNIPPELLKGFDLQNIRVYRDNTFLNAVHAASIATVDGVRKFYWLPEAYKSAFRNAFNGDKGSFLQNFSNGECIVNIAPKLQNIKKYTSTLTSIPERDLELSPQINPDLLFYSVVIHEFTHAERKLYNTDQKYYSCGTSEEFENETSGSVYKIRETRQRAEVAADHESLTRLENMVPEVRKYETALRAISIFKGSENPDGYNLLDDEHDTALYTEAMKTGSPTKALPDIEFKQTENLLLYKYAQRESKKYRPIKNATDAYSEFLPTIYTMYMGMLDVIEDHEKGKRRIVDNMVASARLFVAGLEYLAPKKAQELKFVRNEQKLHLQRTPTAPTVN